MASDYSKLVEALRCKGLSKECDSCGYGFRYCPDSECNDACNVERIIDDAADAIEALQAELEKKRTADCWGCKCEELEPKRGEWIHIEGDDPWEWTCSVCMKKSEIHGEEPAFCPKCGADMRKMEVRDDSAK